MTATETGTTIDVCVDCYMAHHTGEGTPARGRYVHGEALCLIPPGVGLSSGCLECEPCGHPDCAGGPVCGCGWGDPGHGFSRWACGGCGSDLAGNRYPLVVWY